MSLENYNTTKMSDLKVKDDDDNISIDFNMKQCSPTETLTIWPSL